MRDRAYVRITCRRVDAPRFEKLGFVEDDIEGDIAISMVDAETNYGHWEPLQELAKAGVPFFGWHDAGGEYDGCVLASDRTEYAEALCTTHEPRPVAPVNVDGSIDPERLNEAKRYYEVLAKARATLGIHEEPAPGKRRMECDARQGPQLRTTTAWRCRCRCIPSSNRARRTGLGNAP